ncbi:MAG: DUF2252 domain-containing protein [Burkholderiales bacterium]|nr:DUF2252 domain-containing protein [Burkholderiales bacterium]
MDVVRRIRTFNAGRDPERLQLKYRAMRGSAFAFLRGTCHLFYDRLPSGGVFKSAPRVWVCGDLHLENFGSYKGDNRLVYFDISDFDESALAPASWDLVRWLTSLRIGAERLAPGHAEMGALCQAFVDAYGSALALGKAYWVERDTATGLVRELLDRLRDRDRAHFLEGRTTLKGRQRRLRVDGQHALAATAAQRRAVTEFMHDFAQRQLDPPFYKVLDVARRIAGTGSLGVDRYAILVRGKGSPDGNYLLDLKQALPSSLAPHLKTPQPPWPTPAHRVVELQRRVQAVSMAFLQPVAMGGSAYVLRGLQPSEDRIALDRAGRKGADLPDLVRVMGRIVAWAQLRSAGRDGSAGADELIDCGRRNKWKAPLLAAAQDCAEQVRRDAATYNAAFDDGAFGA